MLCADWFNNHGGGTAAAGVVWLYIMYNKLSLSICMYMYIYGFCWLASYSHIYIWLYDASCWVLTVFIPQSAHSFAHILCLINNYIMKFRHIGESWKLISTTSFHEWNKRQELLNARVVKKAAASTSADNQPQKWGAEGGTERPSPRKMRVFSWLWRVLED